jgi:spore germination protein KC
MTILLISFSLFISGCWDSRELDDLAISSGVSFDIDPEIDEHLVTYQSIIPSKVKSGSTDMSGGSGGGGGGEGGVSPAVQLDHLKGKTWLESLGKYSTQGNRILFFPHSQVIIIGMEVAQRGVYPLIEHILRLTQSRPNRLLVLARDKASDILATKDGIETIPATGINGTIKLSAEFSKYPTVTALEFANRLMSKTTSPILPIISIIEEISPGEKKFRKISITGTAVFKGDKMIGELNEQESRGLLWVIDKIEKGFLVVDAPDGSGQATLAITHAKSKIIPELMDGQITITIQIEEQANLAEYPGRQHIDNRLLKQLEKAQAEAIQKEIMSALNKSLALNADVFGFGEAVHRNFKKEWPDLAHQWDEVYPAINVVINVETHINETGDIRKAVIPQ